MARTSGFRFGPTDMRMNSRRHGDTEEGQDCSLRHAAYPPLLSPCLCGSVRDRGHGANIRFPFRTDGYAYELTETRRHRGGRRLFLAPRRLPTTSFSVPLWLCERPWAWRNIRFPFRTDGYAYELTETRRHRGGARLFLAPRRLPTTSCSVPLWLCERPWAWREHSVSVSDRRICV